jgi:hypothetical protein
VVFAAGDSLYFQRFIPEFPAEQGYYLQYGLLKVTGEVVIAIGPTIQSTSIGNVFVIRVDGFAAALPPGQYVLAGYCFSPPNDDVLGGQSREQIYRDNLTLTANLASAQPQNNLQSYNAKMVCQLRETMAVLNQSYVNETDINRVRVLREKRREIFDQLAIFEERLANEMNLDGIKNGQADRSVVRPVFAVFGGGGY